jgi:hypothetical protein
MNVPPKFVIQKRRGRILNPDGTDPVISLRLDGDLELQRHIQGSSGDRQPVDNLNRKRR